MEQGLAEEKQRGELELWTKRIAACRQSGLSARQWCRENGISDSVYYRWQHKLEAAKAKPKFVEAAKGSTVPGKQVVAAMQINGFTVEIYAGVDKDMLSSLCRALRHAE